MLLKDAHIALHQAVKVGAVDLLKLVQELRHLVQLVHVLGQSGLALVVGAVDDRTNLLVDLRRDRLGVVPGVAQVAAQKDLVLVLAVDNRAQAVAEAIAGDHRAGNLGGALQVVGSAGGDVVQHQLFGDAAAQQGDDVLLHALPGLVASVLLRQAHGVAARHAARDDGNLVHLVLRLAVVGGDGVARLVEAGQALILIRHDVALLLRAGNHLDGRLLDVHHGDGLAAASGSQQGRLVDQVFQVSAGEADGGLGDDPQVDVRAQRFILGVDLQDFLPALDIRVADHDLAVKASRTQQRGVEDVAAVGCGDDDDAGVGAKAVHFHQQLV